MYKGGSANNFDSVFVNINGLYYNWYAVKTEKLAPPGWHIPSRREWDTLLTFINKQGYTKNGSTSKLSVAQALAAKTGWNKVIGSDLPENNRSGFNGLPSGYKNVDGTFYGYYGSELKSAWWLPEAADIKTAWTRCLLSELTFCSEANTYDKRQGLTIRLVKN